MAGKRPFQFSLRTLLIAFACLGLLLGLTAPVVRLIALHREYYGAVDWTSNVVCQIYFSPEHGNLDSLRRLCESLDQKTSGPVDMTTLQWVWEECEKSNYRNIDVLCSRWNIITADRVKKALAAGRKVFAWTIDRREELEKILPLGVNAVAGNNPGWLLKELR